ncbi:hypothetical protein RSW80_26390, partial [Escherichia coli]|uniref:hypothetical protein n=1 Tax=Escherichia coli TaxID=562 RepID=UPI0028DDD9AC
EYRRIWKEQFLQLLHSMAEAQAEQHLDANTCLSAVYGALRPLYADRMESHAAHLSESLLQSSKEIMESSADCTIDKKAKINSMLHL